ncbi:MAG: hypothetical protein SVV80_12835 [Planctomycetota bacterium]|nr:hypothetical protein [Planctomycetota bacterium]
MDDKIIKKYQAYFLHRGEWRGAWTDDVPGALAQGKTLNKAGENLKDDISLMLEPGDMDGLPAITGESL